MEKPVVVHAIRGYLSHTETFVGNQITTMRDYRPVVIAHHRSPNREFDIGDMYFVDAQPVHLRKLASSLAYSALKQMVPQDVSAAAHWAAKFYPRLWHFHYAVDAAFFLPLLRKMRLPAVVSLYGYDISSFPNILGGLGRWYIKRAFQEVDFFLAMSEDMKRDAIACGIPEEKILVHYHGINVERFRFAERSYRKKSRFNILCVGTLEPKKGQHHLLRALAKLRTARPDIDAHVTLVGKGDLRPELEEIIRDEGLTGNVNLAGYVPHLDSRFIQYYRDADVFVHFSTTQPDYNKEGIPGTIVEAMAAGLPVISTRHAGIPEVISDGIHGILLDEKNTDGIVTSLITLFEDEVLCQTLGRQAASRALSDLDVRKKTHQLEQIYNAVTTKQHNGFIQTRQTGTMEENPV